MPLDLEDFKRKAKEIFENEVLPQIQRANMEQSNKIIAELEKLVKLQESMIKTLESIVQGKDKYIGILEKQLVIQDRVLIRREDNNSTGPTLPQ